MSNFQATAEFLQGTVKELVAHGITVNGFELDAASLGCLLQMGLGESMGVAEKPPGKKGRAPTIYKILLTQEVVFSTAPVEAEVDVVV